MNANLVLLRSGAGDEKPCFLRLLPVAVVLARNFIEEFLGVDIGLAAVINPPVAALGLHKVGFDRVAEPAQGLLKNNLLLLAALQDATAMCTALPFT